MVPRSQDSPRRKRSRKTGARAAAGELVIRRLTPSRMDELGEVLRGGWGKGCWCIFPRVTAALERELPGPGSGSDRRRRAMEKLARRRRAPGLLAYLEREVVGWIAVAPRAELVRVDRSRATPRVDDVDVWAGGLAEDPRRGSHLGPLFHRIVVDQFTRLRDGDRHHWRRVFPGRLGRVLGRVRLSDVIRRNTGIGDELPDDVFHVE